MKETLKFIDEVMFMLKCMMIIIIVCLLIKSWYAFIQWDYIIWILSMVVCILAIYLFIKKMNDNNT